MMEIKLERMDWEAKKKLAEQIIRNAKLDLTIWIPVLEQVNEALKKYGSKDKPKP